MRHWTPLIFAATTGHADIVSLLLEHGANVTHKDKVIEGLMLVLAE